MPRLVISTVGTSLLTNQVDSEFDPNNWLKRLQQTANYTADEIKKYHEDVSQIIEDLKQRAEEKLYIDNTDVKEIREASAELNGIYGLYDNKIEEGKSDIHWLIATDTAQGQLTAQIVQEFLEAQRLVSQIYTPEQFSTASTNTFTSGIDKLLEWIDDTLPGYKDAGYQVCFNLVGGFKALQGYANTIGMFYADELLYLFEGSDEVIKIPRLPIEINQSVIKPAPFALMAVEPDALVKLSELQGVPETLISVAADKAKLSNWGRLTWNKCKGHILSGELLSFPNLQYEPSFIRDYEIHKEKKERIKLQETLAKVAYLLLENKGDTTPLKGDGGVQYEVYEKASRKQIDGLAHFRVTQALRVSCVTSGNVLILRHYGSNLHEPRNA
jgi:putative CRISPR-associated protein (TIGR02619 family)